MLAEPMGEETLRMLKVLIVEDEALVAMLIEDAVALHGHDVIGVADTATEALRIAAADKPDIALCDVKLSEGQSGVTVADALAAEGVICLYLSGNCPIEAGHRMVVGCLSKPFHTASLGLAIRGAYAVAHGEAPGHLPPGMRLYHPSV